MICILEREMTRRKTREPDDSAERECKTERMEMTKGFRGVVWLSGRPLVSSPCEALGEVERKLEAWFNRGFAVGDEYRCTITLSI
jgi:hypothetical protein